MSQYDDEKNPHSIQPLKSLSASYFINLSFKYLSSFSTKSQFYIGFLEPIENNYSNLVNYTKIIIFTILHVIYVHYILSYKVHPYLRFDIISIHFTNFENSTQSFTLYLKCHITISKKLYNIETYRDHNPVTDTSKELMH